MRKTDRQAQAARLSHKSYGFSSALDGERVQPPDCSAIFPMKDGSGPKGLEKAL